MALDTTPEEHNTQYFKLIVNLTNHINNYMLLSVPIRINYKKYNKQKKRKTELGLITNKKTIRESSINVTMSEIITNEPNNNINDHHNVSSIENINTTETNIDQTNTTNLIPLTHYNNVIKLTINFSKLLLAT